MHATTIRSLLKEQCLRSAFSRSRHWAAGCVCLVAGSQRRRAALALRGAALGAFAVFFAVPLLWLALAPTKTDYELLTRSPLAVGNLDNVRAAWQALNAFENHIFRRWMENSLLYCLSATAITLVTAIPAGYGLAFSRFPGRKAILGLTLVSMLMPASSLVLPVFLELNAMRLIGSAFSIILPFAFFPFGIYLAYIYFATALPRDLLEAARIDGCTNLQTFLRVAAPTLVAGCHAHLLLQLRRGLEQLSSFRTRSWPTRGSSRSRWGFPTSSTRPGRPSHSRR